LLEAARADRIAALLVLAQLAERDAERLGERKLRYLLGATPGARAPIIASSAVGA